MFQLFLANGQVITIIDMEIVCFWRHNSHVIFYYTRICNYKITEIPINFLFLIYSEIEDPKAKSMGLRMPSSEYHKC